MKHTDRRKKFTAPIPWWRCSCGKIANASRKDAKVRARQMARGHAGAFRAYVCQEVTDREVWHVTSQDAETTAYWRDRRESTTH